MSTQPPSTRRKVCGEEGGDPMHATAAELRPTMVTYDSIDDRRVEHLRGGGLGYLLPSALGSMGVPLFIPPTIPFSC